MHIPIAGNYILLDNFLTALNTQRVLWSSNIAKALTRHDPCAASEPGNRTRSPQWLASRGRGFYEPIGAAQHADFYEMMISIDQPLNFWWYQRRSGWNLDIDWKKNPKWDYSQQNETYQQAGEPSRRIVVQLLTNLHGSASICYLFVLKYHETHWNIPSSKMIG